MKKLTIYKVVDDRTYVLRNTNVSAAFVGIGKKGQVNMAEFASLAKDLEPTSTGFSIMDI